MQKYHLNKAQKEAIEYVNGPLIIVAGAGTGKTTVITQKIIYLIEKKLARPEEILALTFTDKAASEMQNRVDAMINVGYVDLQISTFHSFCQKILEQYGINIGLSHNFKLLTETDAWMLVRRNLDKFNLNYYRPLGNPASHVHALISHFAKCKDELISPQDYLNYAENIKMDKDSMNIEEKSRLTEVANAYHVYNQLLLDNSCLDFGDLIFYTIKLLKDRLNILNLLRQKFKYILVDEFQDVNWAQYQLVQLLLSEGIQLTAVGDDDQSIYAFRGASVSNILRFKDDFPQAKEIVLFENYRSNQKILDAAYKLIQYNNPDRLEAKLKIDKKLKSQVASSRGGAEYIYCANLDEEVRRVIDKIIKLKTEDAGAVWDDFAILVRANNHSGPFIAGLEKVGVPYEFLAAAGLYRQPIILDCINYLKLLDNFHESAAIYRLLCMPVWNFEATDMQKITANAKKKSISFYETLRRAQEFALSDAGLKIINKLLNLIQAGTERARSEKPTTVIYKFLEESGYLEFLIRKEEEGDNHYIHQIYQLKEFFEYVNNYEITTLGAGVTDFLQHYTYIIESGDLGSLYQPSETPDSVNIITVHKAKGLEFKYVFMVNLVEDRFPTRKKGEAIEVPALLVKEQLPEGDSHYQEERRLFYVAMTRAKEKLYLFNAGDYGGVRQKKISRFLTELGFNQGLKTDEAKNIGSSFKAPGLTIKKKANFVYELPKALSFSQIKAYSVCPYQYKLAHIIKIPLKGNASFSFGQSVHATLQKFYQRLQELNKSNQGSLFTLLLEQAKIARVKAPSLEELLAFYEQSWIEDWYDSKKQRESFYKLGKDILKIFYESQQDNWTIPIALEGWFKIKIGDYLLHGRIDRIDKLADGTLEIIDYKTGAAKEKVEGEDKDQLLIYQMAVEQLPEYKSAGVLNKLSYYYLNDNIKLSFLGQEQEIKKLQDKLIKTTESIYAGDFAATPGRQACKYCDFKNICQYRV